MTYFGTNGNILIIIFFQPNPKDNDSAVLASLEIIHGYIPKPTRTTTQAWFLSGNVQLCQSLLISCLVIHFVIFLERDNK